MIMISKQLVVEKHMRQLIMVLLVSLCFTGLAQAEKAPDFNVPSAMGEISLGKLRGHVVYLDFWASWCVPCRKSFPWLNEMQVRYDKSGLKIIAINLDEERQLADSFLKKYPAKFTVGFDPKGKSASAYGLRGMPSSYLIDRKGQLLSSHIGFRSDDRAALEQKISQALAK